MLTSRTAMRLVLAGLVVGLVGLCVARHWADRVRVSPEQETPVPTKGTESPPSSANGDAVTSSDPASHIVEIAGLTRGELVEILRGSKYSPTTRNNAANRLLNERAPDLAGELIRMLKDETESVTWRNNCVQFLRGCYEQSSVPGSEFHVQGSTSARPKPEGKAATQLETLNSKPETSVVPPLARAEILAVLLETCQSPKPELSSCALWSLAQLAAPTALTPAPPPGGEGNAGRQDARPTIDRKSVV